MATGARLVAEHSGYTMNGRVRSMGGARAASGRGRRRHKATCARRRDMHGGKRLLYTIKVEEFVGEHGIEHLLLRWRAVVAVRSSRAPTPEEGGLPLAVELRSSAAELGTTHVRGRTMIAEKEQEKERKKKEGGREE